MNNSLQRALIENKSKFLITWNLSEARIFARYESTDPGAFNAQASVILLPDGMYCAVTADSFPLDAYAGGDNYEEIYDSETHEFLGTMIAGFELGREHREQE